MNNITLLAEIIVNVKNGDDWCCSDCFLRSVPDKLPSSVRTLDFSFNYLSSLYNTTFHRLNELVSLDLTRCGIAFIYDDIFQNQQKLEHLILTGNPIVFIADTAFSALINLKYLSMVQASVNKLTDIPIANLNNLEILDLSGNDIQSLKGLDNFYQERLKKLRLDKNSIEKIERDDLRALKDGMDISFKGNDIVSIEAGAFEALKFHSLDFSDCFNKVDISVILTGLRGVTTNILKLGVYKDSPKTFIQSLSLQNLSDVTVQEINFQLQHFKDLKTTTFEGLTNLERLDFTRTHMSFLNIHISSLIHLVLNENNFEDICNISMANFSDLTHLSIRGNLWSKGLTLQKSCLASLSLLERLDLSHSNLKTGASCCANQLSGLSNLKHLNLSYNFAMQWDPLPFNATPQLRLLDCSHLYFTLNSSAPFQNLLLLETLNLSYTSVDLSNLHLFEGLKKLRLLNLKGNIIQGGTVTETTFSAHFLNTPLLQNLILSACGITSIEKKAFQVLSQLVYADLSENELLLLTTSAFFSLKQIHLNFARNTIVTVEVRDVEDLGENSSIDLSHNPLACNCTNIQFINWVKANGRKMKHLEETVCAATKPKSIDYIISNTATHF
ncbi:CD180 antigen [Chanos chanos]|uniref:CD180 antigen n=1 Tax=Chanos chanos TaxID=29144 RepID=A0A6J2UT99_CHACN|nr:CD180 antigen [Chanos chanos]